MRAWSRSRSSAFGVLCNKGALSRLTATASNSFTWVENSRDISSELEQLNIYSIMVTHSAAVTHDLDLSAHGFSPCWECVVTGMQCGNVMTDGLNFAYTVQYILMFLTEMALGYIYWPILRRYTSKNIIMAHHTVKFGGADSHVVVAKVAVSSGILLMVPLHLYRLYVLMALVCP